MSLGQSLRSQAPLAVSGLATGTSNPGSPSTNDLFYRTDLGLLIFFDGTRWLTVAEYQTSIQAPQTGISASGDIMGRQTLRSDLQLYATRVAVFSRVLTTNTGAAFWTVSILTQNSTPANTTLLSFTTASDAPDVIVSHDSNVNTAIATTQKGWTVSVAKTGSPGAIFAPATIFYRLIVT